jgi:hypothetical protein
MNVAVCGLFIVVLLWSQLSNPDICSPAKLFLFSFLIFHLGALNSRTSYELWMLILLVLLVGATSALFEAVSPLPPPTRYALELRRHSDPDGFLWWTWVLSAPAVAAQVFLLWKSGGIAAYINAVGNRIIEFRGYGWAVTLSATMVIFNLAYFAVGLTRKRSRGWWSLYLVHYLVALAIGLLSGSRSGFLSVFAIQVFCYHYIRGRVRLTRALPLALALVFVALLLGVVRNAVRVENDTLSLGPGSRDQTLAYGTFNYGVGPLQILLDADHLKLAYGMTLVSVVTNVVPRDWWPDKPDTGGVYFTKEYAGNAWGGASNLTPTLLGESIINFGWIPGIALYALGYPALMFLVIRYYRRTVVWARATGGATAALELLLYVCVVWAVVGLMIAEVTTSVQALVMTRIVPLLVLRVVLGLPLRPQRVLTPDPGLGAQLEPGGG